MAKKIKGWLKIASTLTAGLILLVMITAAFLDQLNWNHYRKIIASLSERYLGEKIEISGDLEGRLLTLEPWINAHQITISPVAKNSGQVNFHCDTFHATMRLMPAFLGHIILDQVELDHADLRIVGPLTNKERASTPSENIDSTLNKHPMTVTVRHTLITNSFISYRSTDGHDEMPITPLHFRRLVVEQRAGESIRAEGTGSIENERVSLNVAFNKIGRDAQAEGSALTLCAVVESNRLCLQGTIASSKTEHHFNFELAANLPRLHRILTLLGLPVNADTPHCRAHAHVHGNFQHFEFDHVLVRLGHSRAQAAGSVNLGTAIPEIQADVVIPILDINDLKPLIAKGGASEPKTAHPNQTHNFAALANDRKPFDLHHLRSVNVVSHITINRLIAPRVNALATDLHAQIDLHHGHLAIQPLSAVLAGGKVNVAFELNASSAETTATAQIGLDRVMLETLIEPFLPDQTIKALGTKPSTVLRGRFGSIIRLRTSGHSPQEFLTNLYGNVAFAMENGSINASISDVLLADLSGFVEALLERGKTAALHCLIVHAPIENGIAHLTTMLLATEDANLIVRGQVNLMSQTVNLAASTYPKDLGIGSINSQVNITGKISHPKLSLESTPIVAKAAAAAGFAVVAGPAAALIPLIEPAVGNKGACAAYASQLAQVQERAKALTH